MNTLINPSWRIALLTHSVRPRGGVVHTLELAEALCARGHAVTVIASVEPGEVLFRGVACPVRLLPLPTLGGDLVAQVRQRIDALVQGLPALLRAGGFDLVHAQDSLSGNALALLQDSGVPLPPWVRTVHHLDHFSEPLLAAWQTRAWRRAASVACVSDSWCAHMQDIHQTTAWRMYNGVNLQRYTPVPAQGDAMALQALGWRDQGQPLCLAVGGVEQRKNSLRLLQAFAQLRRSDPAWAQAQLVMAGGASMLDHSAARSAWAAQLADWGWQEGPDQPVWRTGPLAEAAVPALMRRATLLAMPSLVEGFGLVALEALACGTPVLVSHRAPFTEHLAGCATVAWCEPEDVASIAAGLQQAARLPRLTAPPPVCLQHSWQRSAATHEAWYARVLRGAQAVDGTARCAMT